MTIIESGVIAGAITFAIVGGVTFGAHGMLGVVLGSLAGLVIGAVAGWIFALFVILELSMVGVLWRAARKRTDTTPSEADMGLMTPIAAGGIMLGALLALVCWHTAGWLYAIAAAVGIASVFAVIAVARCELR